MSQIKTFTVQVLKDPTTADTITGCFRIGSERSIQQQRGATDAGGRGRRTRPILVSFSTYDAKLKFLVGARKCKTGSLIDPVYVNDDLTATRRRAYKVAIQMKKHGILQEVAVLGGNLKIKYADSSVKFLTKLVDFDEIINSG